MDRQVAQDFFSELTEFSKRVFQNLHLPEISPWRRDAWPGAAQPRGAVVHYTADPDFYAVLRWFMDPKWEARASAHAVVGREWTMKLRDLSVGLPRVAALEVPVVQCVPIDMVSWHATWACGETYGIEVCNMGELKLAPDAVELGFVSWQRKDSGSDEWTKPWPGEAVQVFNRWFEPWMPTQVVTVVHLLRAVEAIKGTFQNSWIVGHEHVQGRGTRVANMKGAETYKTDKTDPGLHFPMEWVRAAVFTDEDIKQMPWYLEWKADQSSRLVSDPEWEHLGFALAQRTRWVRAWGNNTDDPKHWPMGGDAAWSSFRNQMRVFPMMVQPFGSLGKLGLRMLGYAVSDVIEEELREVDKQSVWLFQRLSGLDTDMVPGEHTKGALLARLIDRGLV